VVKNSNSAWLDNKIEIKIGKKLSKSCQKAVKKLSKNCQKVVKKQSKSCQKIVKNFAHLVIIILKFGYLKIKILKRVGEEGEEGEGEEGDL
jgi:hypothetical protein